MRKTKIVRFSFNESLNNSGYIFTKMYAMSMPYAHIHRLETYENPLSTCPANGNSKKRFIRIKPAFNVLYFFFFAKLFVFLAFMANFVTNFMFDSISLYIVIITLVTPISYLAIKGIVFPSSINFTAASTCHNFTFNSSAIIPFMFIFNISFHFGHIIYCV